MRISLSASTHACRSVALRSVRFVHGQPGGDICCRAALSPQRPQVLSFVSQSSLGWTPTVQAPHRRRGMFFLFCDKRSPGGGRLEPPVADLAAPLEGMTKPFITQAAGAHNWSDAETRMGLLEHLEVSLRVYHPCVFTISGSVRISHMVPQHVVSRIS